MYMTNSTLNKMKEKMVALRELAEQNAISAMPESFKAPEDVRIARFEICSSCEYLYKPTNTCKVCGCFMGVKTGIAGSKCPKGKWLAYTKPA